MAKNISKRRGSKRRLRIYPKKILETTNGDSQNRSYLLRKKKPLKTRLHGQIDNLAAYLCSSERICRLLDARKPSELDGICAASLELLKSEVSVVCTNGIQVISLGLPYVSYVQQ